MSKRKFVPKWTPTAEHYANRLVGVNREYKRISAVGAAQQMDTISYLNLLSRETLAYLLEFEAKQK